MKKIGFIGLGNMGGPMAVNLVKAGYVVTAFDLVESALEQFVEQGGQRAPSAADAVSDADAVVSMLPASKHVEALYLGDDELLSASTRNASHRLIHYCAGICEKSSCSG